MRPAWSSAGTGRSMSALWPRDPFGTRGWRGPLVALCCTPAWTSQRQFLVRQALCGAGGRVLRASVLAP